MEITVTDNNYQEVLSSELPIVLDFWATWCGPCRQIGPYIAELAEEYAGRVVVGKCNIEEATDLTSDYGIMSVPTVVFIKNGERIEDLDLVGSMSKADIKENIEKLF
ncbi:MAG: thioredoxin [Bacteroidaceae bacterium]|jgi:thioredoxin 1|nr:thioredoxin [Bacteroidales bacterium]MBQ4038777.1 thioredoxin [Bacteroidaceae bacterium]MBR5890919.1 thioredoxin [Bacteroidaceae bacterium]MBR6805063.1 thioredoxin [Bacteroidaceae bacterium]